VLSWVTPAPPRRTWPGWGIPDGGPPSGGSGLVVEGRVGGEHRGLDVQQLDDAVAHDDAADERVVVDVAAGAGALGRDVEDPVDDEPDAALTAGVDDELDARAASSSPYEPSRPDSRTSGMMWPRYCTTSRPPTRSIDVTGISSRRVTMSSGMARLPAAGELDDEHRVRRRGLVHLAARGRRRDVGQHVRAPGERRRVEDQDRRTRRRGSSRRRRSGCP
jgi:hypothetical protein